MPYVLGLAGKGGTGKTTVAALFIRYLVETAGKTVLAIDADPNSNLGEALGLEVGTTIADLLDETKAIGGVPAGMTKTQYVQYKLQSALVETERLDLLSMGAPEGPGCYCYPNDLLRGHMEDLARAYDYLVLDNEAGLEHLSRRVAQDVSLMVVVSDASVRGVRSAGRVGELVRNLKLAVDRIGLVVTKIRVPGELEALSGAVEASGLEFIGAVPYDEDVVRLDLEGRALAGLPAESPAVRAVSEIARKMEIGS